MTGWENDEGIQESRRRCRKGIVAQIMIGQKVIDLFKAIIIHGNGGIQKFAISPEFNTRDDIQHELIPVLLTYPEHLDIGGCVVDIAQYQPVHMIPLSLQKQLGWRQGAIK
jgi:hypothetical protein